MTGFFPPHWKELGRDVTELSITQHSPSPHKLGRYVHLHIYTDVHTYTYI